MTAAAPIVLLVTGVTSVTADSVTGLSYQLSYHANYYCTCIKLSTSAVTLTVSQLPVIIKAFI